MKKTLFAGLLLATMGMTNVNAKTLTYAQPESEQCITVCVTYVTENVGGCQVTYKVTTTYLFCIPICSLKCEISRVCGNTGGSQKP